MSHDENATARRVLDTTVSRAAAEILRSPALLVAPDGSPVHAPPPHITLGMPAIVLIERAAKTKDAVRARALRLEALALATAVAEAHPDVPMLLHLAACCASQANQVDHAFMLVDRALAGSLTLDEDQQFRALRLELRDLRRARDAEAKASRRMGRVVFESGGLMEESRTFVNPQRAVRKAKTKNDRKAERKARHASTPG